MPGIWFKDVLRFSILGGTVVKTPAYISSSCVSQRLISQDLSPVYAQGSVVRVAGLCTKVDFNTVQAVILKGGGAAIIRADGKRG